MPAAGWPFQLISVALICALTTGCYPTTLIPPQSLS